MNVFRKFTQKSLLQNRTRTFVTIIGIILSMALITAVIEGAYSGLQFLIRSEVERDGAYHAYYYDLTAEQMEKAINSEGVSEATYWQEVGWADIGSTNEYKPYLLIESIGNNFSDLVAVNLLSGRMPENENEILLPEHLSSNGSVNYEVGDTLTLSVGKRISNNRELNEYNPYNPDELEEIEYSTEITYTVVGTYSRLDHVIEEYSSPGYTALTAGRGTGSGNVFFTLENPADFYSYMENSAISMNWREHTDLLRYSGSIQDGNLTTVVYGLAAVLIFLIAFGSISLIYNSFSISVNERAKQFGILKSVGATKKQISSSVLYEALLLCAISIPIGLLVGCAGIELTFLWLKDSITGLLGSGYSTEMYLVINPLSLIVSIIVCLITTLIAAWIPARRTINVSAIETIRQNNDIQIKGKDVKTSKLSQRIFGLEGMIALKNFKRNRKKYRSTVFSLFLSVTLFITASSFYSYLTNTLEGFTSSYNSADITYSTTGVNRSNSSTVFDLLAEADGIDNAIYMDTNFDNIYFDSNSISEDYFDLPFIQRSNYEDGDVDCSGSIIFINDDAFRQLCIDNGLEPNDYFDPEEPKAVIYNETTSSISDESGSRKFYNYKILNEQTFPSIGYIREIREYDGYYYMGETLSEDGEIAYIYYPNDYLEEFWAKGDESGEPLDESMAMIVAEEEAVKRINFTINSSITNKISSITLNTMAIFYPYSMKNIVFSEEIAKEYFDQTDFAFETENHVQTYDSMKKILAENNMATDILSDQVAVKQSQRLMLSVVNVFSYGFIILISLIAMANVFNTISTSIALRRHEFGILKSIGLSEKGFRRMMIYECVVYGIKGLSWGLPASVVMTYIIYRITGIAYDMSFYIPWSSILIAVGSVFVVVFTTMIYATTKIKKDSLIDDLKMENI